MPDKPQSIAGVLDAILDQTEGQDEASVDDLLDRFGGRSFGPLLLVPAVVVITPIGAIPGVPSLMGLLVVLIAAQAVVGRPRPWVPKRLRDRAVSRDRLADSLERARPWARWFDGFTASRLTPVVDPPMHRVLAVVCIAVAATLPPLELIPFAGATAGLALACFAVAFTARDGLFALVGLLATGGVGVFCYYAVKTLL